ncbi:MAG TPA: RhuM family protein [Afipia sp.]
MKKPTDYDKAIKKAKTASKIAHAGAKQLEFELVQFKTENGAISFNIDVTGDTVWASQQQIADLFERDKRTVSEHIRAIFAEGELSEDSVVRNFRLTASDGKSYDIAHYDLDMILAVGFRVKSPKATEFRKWAYQTLRSYLVEGYALNEARLRADPLATNKLAAALRAIRSDEKNIYAQVREFFKQASIDYDSASPACRSFYALLQDKLHYAITTMTASQIILDRADHKEPNMGLQSFAGNMPKIDEAKIAKNYLGPDELFVLHILCEQFLLLVESKALRQQKMAMKDLAKKLDDLMKVNDYPVFAGYKGKYDKDLAMKHATEEYARFLVRLKKDDVRQIVH